MWLRNINLLKVAHGSVNKQAILSSPTSVDSFNPTTSRGLLPELSSLQDELSDIYSEYEQQFHDALEDPTTEKNKMMLSEQEKTTIQQFADGQITLNHQYARTLIEIIKKLQHSFTKVEIDHSDMLRIFSKPMKKQEALDALARYIEDKSHGHRPEDVRIIIK